MRPPSCRHHRRPPPPGAPVPGLLHGFCRAQALHKQVVRGVRGLSSVACFLWLWIGRLARSSALLRRSSFSIATTGAVQPKRRGADALAIPLPLLWRSFIVCVWSFVLRFRLRLTLSLAPCCVFFTCLVVWWLVVLANASLPCFGRFVNALSLHSFVAPSGNKLQLYRLCGLSGTASTPSPCCVAALVLVSPTL